MSSPRYIVAAVLATLFVASAENVQFSRWTYTTPGAPIKGLVLDIPSGNIVVTTQTSDEPHLVGAYFSIDIATSGKIQNPFKSSLFDFNPTTRVATLNLTESYSPDGAVTALRGPAGSPIHTITGQVNVTLGRPTVMADVTILMRGPDSGALVHGPPGTAPMIHAVSTTCDSSLVCFSGFQGTFYGPLSSIGGSTSLMQVVANGIAIKGAMQGGCDIYNATSVDLETGVLAPFTVSSTGLLRTLGYTGVGNLLGGSDLALSTTGDGELLALSLDVSCSTCSFTTQAGQLQLGDLNITMPNTKGPPGPATSEDEAPTVPVCHAAAVMGRNWLHKHGILPLQSATGELARTASPSLTTTIEAACARDEAKASLMRDVAQASVSATDGALSGTGGSFTFNSASGTVLVSNIAVNSNGN